MPRPARILVTREHAEPLAGAISEGGAVPVFVPLLARAPSGEAPPSANPDVVVISSAFVVQTVPDLAARVGKARVVAVGRATAAALAGAGVVVAAVGEHGGAEAVTLTAAEAGEVLWHVGGEDVAAPLAAALAACPAEVVRWVVYRTRVPHDAADRLRAALPVDVVTFASPSAVDAFADRAAVGEALVAVIGETTAARTRERGLPVHAVAARPGIEGLAAAALSLVSGRTGG